MNTIPNAQAPVSSAIGFVSGYQPCFEGMAMQLQDRQKGSLFPT